MLLGFNLDNLDLVLARGEQSKEGGSDILLVGLLDSNNEKRGRIMLELLIVSWRSFSCARLRKVHTTFSRAMRVLV